MLSLRNVTVKFGKRNILKDVSLSFSAPLTYIIGLNGSGKTTLLRTLCGWLDYEGDIFLEDKNLKSISEKTRACHLAMVHQRMNVSNLIPVSEFVLMGRFPHVGWMGNYAAEDRNVANSYIKKLGLDDFVDRKLDEISGGEFQKVLLARALTQEAEIILMDEPTQSLDPLNREMVYEMIDKLVEAGKKVICTSHDMEILENQSAKIIGIKNGEVVWEGNGGIDFEEIKEKVYR